MPCTYYGSLEADRDHGQRDHVDKLTAMLCGLCAGVAASGNGYLIAMDLNLDEWWRRHQSLDTNRKLREQAEENRKAALRKAALAKLSQFEIEALGLRGVK